MPRKKSDPLDFQVFWDAYGLHRDRYAAKSVWDRMPEKDRRAALAGIEAYREDCRRRGVAMAYGVRYLKHRRWEDEYDDVPVQSAQPVQQADLFDDPFADMETW
jgi:hypothetical protein